jgi:hypothetical protein
VIYRTRDGGETWESFSTPFKSGSPTFFDAHKGWVESSRHGCGAGSCWVELFMTSNGGETWEQVFPGPPFTHDENWPPGTITVLFRAGLLILSP